MTVYIHATFTTADLAPAHLLSWMDVPTQLQPSIYIYRVRSCLAVKNLDFDTIALSENHLRVLSYGLFWKMASSLPSV